MKIIRRVDVERTPRVMQMEGIFDVQPSPESTEEWDVTLPLDERPWSIGLIVGPSGSGKSTIAREVFGDAVVTGYDWPSERSILDGFPPGMGIKDIVGALSSVGFNSPPLWRRPFRVLSTGQQFRVTVARALAEAPDLAVIDEFTSVVDRTVAQIGCVAVGRAIRRSGRRFVAVACHYDVIDWLQPDWTYEPADNLFQWRSLQRRPDVTLTIRRVAVGAWRIFSKYHYLTQDHHPSAACYMASLADGSPVAWISMIWFPGRAGGWRIHRDVVLPDYSGIGIGHALADRLAAIYAATGRPVYTTAGHPAIMRRVAAGASPWEMVRRPSIVARRNRDGSDRHAAANAAEFGHLTRTVSATRLTCGLRYTGQPDPDGARSLGVVGSASRGPLSAADRASLAAAQRARRAVRRAVL